MVKEVSSGVLSIKRWAPWLMLAAVLTLVMSWWVLKPTESTDFRGVRLGLSASDTRASFQTSGQGEWSSEANPEPSLRWKASAGGLIREAVFEFHQGMLVAIRMKVDPSSLDAQGAPLQVTPAQVISRERVEGDVVVTVLSRSCPTHTTEVLRLLQGGS